MPIFPHGRSIFFVPSKNMPNMKIHRTMSGSVASLAAILAAFPFARADYSDVTQFGHPLPQPSWRAKSFSQAGSQRPHFLMPRPQAVNDPAGSQLDPETLRLAQVLALVTVGITGALMLGCCLLSGALVYQKCAKPIPLATEMRPFSGDSDFEYGLCEGLCHSWRITCWGCCCSPVLWSATASSPKSNLWGWDFWWMIGLETMIFSLSFFLAQVRQWFPIWIVNFISINLAFHLLIMVHHRQHLRRIFSMEHGTFRSLIQDFFTWVCCGVCATIQEALQVGYVGDPVLNTPLRDDGRAPVPMHMLS